MGGSTPVPPVAPYTIRVMGSLFEPLTTIVKGALEQCHEDYTNSVSCYL